MICNNNLVILSPFLESGDPNLIPLLLFGLEPNFNPQPLGCQTSLLTTRLPPYFRVYRPFLIYAFNLHSLCCGHLGHYSYQFMLMANQELRKTHSKKTCKPQKDLFPQKWFNLPVPILKDTHWKVKAKQCFSPILHRHRSPWVFQ